MGFLLVIAIVWVLLGMMITVFTGLDEPSSMVVAGVVVVAAGFGAYALLQHLVEKADRLAAAEAEKAQREADARAIKRQQAAEEEEVDLVRSYFDLHPSHVPVMRRIYDREVFEDEFGDEQLQGWHVALKRFVEEKMQMGGELFDMDSMLDKVQRELHVRWQLAQDEAGDEHCGGDRRSHHWDGRRYERDCMALLSRAGWRCQVTPISGDQGVDLVARRDDCVLAVQCKKQNRPVGNSAVQEVESGRLFYSCTHSAVVSNAGFTSSARRLAQTTGTALLYTADLTSFAP